MSYTLGFIYADGAIYKSSRGNYLAITSIDKDVLNMIKGWMDSKHNIYKTTFKDKNRKTKYLLRIGNKEMFYSLLNIGVSPNKSLTMVVPNIPKKFLPDFVRGYFDGDGCVYLERAKGLKKNKIVKRLSIIFTSGSREFLKKLLIVLQREAKIKQTKIYNSHRSYQIRLSTQDALKVFGYMYSGAQKEYFLERKFKIFKKYFNLRPQRVDGMVKSILEFHKQ